MCKAYALTAVLIACNLSDYLCCNIAGSGKAVGLFNKGFADNCSVLEHILKVDKVAVMHMLCEIIGIVEMYQAFLISFNNISRKKNTSCNILADLACHIVTLNAVYNGVLVGIFLNYLFIVAFKKSKNAVIGSVCLTDKGTVVTVFYITSCNLKCTLGHDLVFDHILYFFY